jgi:hypothetical protein
MIGALVGDSILAVQHDAYYAAGLIFGEVFFLIIGGGLVAWASQRIRWHRRGSKPIANPLRLIGVIVALVAGLLLVLADVGGIMTRASNRSTASPPVLTVPPAKSTPIAAEPSQTLSPATTPPVTWPTLRGYTPRQMATDPTFGGDGGITPIVGIRGTGPQTMPVGLTPAQILGSFGSSSGATVYLVPAGQQPSSLPIYSQTIAGSGGIFSDITTAGVYDLIVETAPGVHWTAILGHRPS